MRYKTLIFLLLTSLAKLSFAQIDKTLYVPLGGNTFANNTKENTITKNGIENWTDKNTSFKVYVYFSKKGNLSVSLKDATKIVGENVLSFSINNQVKSIKLVEGQDFSSPIGNWDIKDTGYVAIEIKGLSKSSGQFPNLQTLALAGSAVTNQTYFVKDNNGNFFYWGRRGPSVHLNYQIPEKVEAEWFYNEIVVPKGNDVIGSYFMANGFGEGYFGIQVNSPTERRVLFSVWSPFETDNPKEIPADHKILMLKKGTDVHTGEFGNEGAGGQSYLKYNWKADVAYKFLLHAVPSADNYTTYTAYFFAPELNKWQLIASFKRPQTQTYVKRPHSFLENFIPEIGDKERMVLFKNQWICDTKGNWIALNSARFTTDNTGNLNYRKDYAGGILDGEFYLRNCGFFSNFTQAKTMFTKKEANQKPIVDLSKLP